MCGIFCSLSHHGFLAPSAHTKQLLQNRGPDSSGQHQAIIATQFDHNTASSSQIHATFVSTVLSLRGKSIVEQPLVDQATGSVLCWNGEAWIINADIVEGNDSNIVFSQLLEACRDSAELSIRAITSLLSSVRGPYAFVFYDAPHRRLYYARDCLGRRSLLKKTTQDGTLVLSSVCDNAIDETWVEAEADGIYMVDIPSVSETRTLNKAVTIPHRRSDQDESPDVTFVLPFPALNRAVSYTEVTDRLRSSLQTSLERRIHHVREAIQPSPDAASEHQARIAVLFSGGLDCTILARMCHDLRPLHQPIDLINVAFENPRIHSSLDPGSSPYELCPDRITGRASHLELVTVCPGRLWRFLAVNVPYTEAQAHRNTVITLMHPHNTEMDLSISFALYFASRGNGLVSKQENTPPEPYSTPAHVLLSGLGADELFGGYQRHSTAFSRHGYPGLLDELELDFNRLGKRNLGRDDRVISNCGKEVRFPYLDEDFIALALQLPVTAKCDFNVPSVEGATDPEQLLAPEKRALRVLAWQLGMRNAASEKKRAIQFGARTAKMETGRVKGTNVVS